MFQTKLFWVYTSAFFTETKLAAWNWKTQGILDSIEPIYLQFLSQVCMGIFQLVTTSTSDRGNSICSGLLTLRSL